MRNTGETWPQEALSRDGARFRIRPIRPDDLERERRFIQELSAESRFNRLLHAMREPSVDFLHRMVEVDYRQTMALVAVVDGADGEHFIGVARYAADDTTRTAEFAFAVADDWQGRGIGTQLAQQLFRYARSHGILRLHGDILATNQRMIDLARHLGMQVSPHAEDARLVRATIALDAS